MKPFIGIKTKEAVAKFYFNPGRDAVNFCYGNGDIDSLIPLFIIYKEILFVPDDFTDPNFELINYKCNDITSLNALEYKAFCQFLIDEAKAYRKEIFKPYNTDHAADSLSYYVESVVSKLPKNEVQAEKKLIDQLDIPALGNSLNEAVRIENYPAAAYIRKKIENAGHLIFEDDGWLKIRMKKDPDGLNGKDYNNVFYPGH